ncbi:uncharacterized protein LOC128954853 [Oppia nitens]|uniref:uncharacterized protein LOC128954853 n=1 Tax=Oppia nitens TaxID=1686743 RepID=UPI0023DB6C6C|nr:uncharacterized protein LOC128954853 [Oppia nitens]
MITLTAQSYRFLLFSSVLLTSSWITVSEVIPHSPYVVPHWLQPVGFSYAFVPSHKYAANVVSVSELLRLVDQMAASSANFDAVANESTEKARLASKIMADSAREIKSLVKRSEELASAMASASRDMADAVRVLGERTRIRGRELTTLAHNVAAAGRSVATNAQCPKASGSGGGGGNNNNKKSK